MSKIGSIIMNREAERLRALAAWYREYAERTENPTIWDLRLRTADNLERQARDLENGHAPHRVERAQR